MVDAQHDGLLVCFLFCFVLFIFCLPSFCFRYPFSLFWRQHLIFSFGGLSSPTLATAPDAPARVGVRERLGLRQHLAAAWRRQRKGRGRGGGRGGGGGSAPRRPQLAAASGRSGVSSVTLPRGQVQQWPRRPIGFTGRQAIDHERGGERAQCPLSVPRGKQAPRGGKAAEFEPVEAAGFGSLKSCSRFSRDRKTARDEAGTQGK